MDSALFWIDMITDPAFAMWIGLMAGLGVSLMVTAVVGLIRGRKIEERTLVRVLFFTFLLVTFIIWALEFALIIWYNTPLGQSLELT